jgi:hypothetical protein
MEGRVTTAPPSLVLEVRSELSAGLIKRLFLVPDVCFAVTSTLRIGKVYLPMPLRVPDVDLYGDSGSYPDIPLKAPRLGFSGCDR